MSMTQIVNVRPRLGFGDAVKSGFSKYVTFSGRARRSEYWWWTLFSFIMGLLSLIPFVGWIISLAMILPSLAMSVRRLHDVGRTGWWLLAPLGFSILGGILLAVGGVAGLGGHGSGGGITAVLGGILAFLSVVSSILVLVWAFFDSKPETNKYGPSPKYEVAASEDTLHA